MDAVEIDALVRSGVLQPPATDPALRPAVPAG